MNRRSFFALLGLAPAVMPRALQTPTTTTEIMSRNFPEEWSMHVDGEAMMKALKECYHFRHVGYSDGRDRAS